MKSDTKHISNKYKATVFKPCESDPSSMYSSIEVRAVNETVARMNINRTLEKYGESDKSWFDARIVSIKEE